MLLRASAIVVLLALMAGFSLPSDLPRSDAVIAGAVFVWCDSVPVPAGCPAPLIQGGGQLAPACAGLVVNRAGGGWPGQLMTGLNSDNCANKLVFKTWNCGDRPLTKGECTPHRAWVPGF